MLTALTAICNLQLKRWYDTMQTVYIVCVLYRKDKPILTHSVNVKSASELDRIRINPRSQTLSFRCGQYSNNCWLIHFGSIMEPADTESLPS